MASASRTSLVLAHTPSLSNSQLLSRTCCSPSTSGLGVTSLVGRPLRLGKVAQPNRHLGNARVVKTFAATESGKSTTTAVSESASDRREKEVDDLMEPISFGQLCDDFECISSPAVERTARQLARDILDLRESQRLLSCFAIGVQYKDPLRSFSGRDKYKRTSWIQATLEQTTVYVLKMEMQSSSELIIRWRVKGKIKIPPANILGQELSFITLSKFKINQISGQVTEQVDEWDLSQTSPLSAVFFWSSRIAWSLAELANDGREGLSSLTQKLNAGNDNGNIYADPTDPRKFFQESNPNGDLYQIAFFVALVYLVVQTVRLIL